MVWSGKTGKRRTFLAISPPSDIVMDVARAVDPADIETARAALAKRAGGAAGTFSLDTAASVDAGSILSRATADKAAAATDPAKKFKKFEAMVLQTFIQNMLPKDTEGVYGKGLAGDMWKSQLAERVADVMAERGGIGIAKSMLADHYLEGKRVVPVGPVSGGPEKTEVDQQNSLSTSLVHQLQRKAAGSMTGDETTIKTNIRI
ncbi:rod-binding protein [Mesorhizobium sp. AD1-1]|uniref:rod-binding protein n=1 Tax=Mesorhizobium sp. AD1-1 TaxID=2876621 RepID=UPI0029625203|nr:rod-binding protein [Mesorhizobium sp. AD1-1]